MCKAAGFVGGMEIPPISEALTGFINGAKSVDPNFKVYSTYIGNFEDAAAAKEAALSMIAQGADCIVPDADAAGQGVFQAVVEKKDQGAKTFGVFMPATEAAPGQVLANYVSDYGQGVVNLAKQVKEGTFKGGENVHVRLRHARRDQVRVRPDVDDPGTPGREGCRRGCQEGHRRRQGQHPGARAVVRKARNNTKAPRHHGRSR